MRLARAGWATGRHGAGTTCRCPTHPRLPPGAASRSCPVVAPPGLVASVEIEGILLVEGEEAPVGVADLHYLRLQQTGLNAIAEGCGLCCGCHVQRFGQQANAAVILSQGCAALAVQGQDTHQLAVTLLLPGREFQRTLQIVDGLGIRPAAGIEGRHVGQRLQDLNAQLLLLAICQR